MKRIRVIPALLIKDKGLVKSVKFKAHKYVGDPINAVKIFNEKEVDEILVLDISATDQNRGPDFDAISNLASEAFMPLAYGGGITSLDEIKKLFRCGVEKVVINHGAFKNPSLVRQGADYVGSQSIVVSIDVKKNFFGKYKVYTENGKKNTNLDPANYARDMEAAGAGELLLNAIDKDGTFEGYDAVLIKEVAGSVQIPVVAVGGASGIADFEIAVRNGASAVAAGSLFVFQMPHRAVLISYPSETELRDKLYSNFK